jgi:hypothetical protein
MTDDERRRVWIRIMRRPELGPFALDSTELRQIVNGFDAFMDVAEAQLAGRIPTAIRAKASARQFRGILMEIMRERLNG